MSAEPKRRKTINTDIASRITLWLANRVEEFDGKIDRNALTIRIHEDLSVIVNENRTAQLARSCGIRLLVKKRKPIVRVEKPLDTKNRTPVLAKVLEHILQDAEQQLGLKPGSWGRKNGARKNLRRICDSLAIHPMKPTKAPNLTALVAAKQAVVEQSVSFDDLEEDHSDATKTG
jgi:hypothetical protein